ncbi:MAG: alpha/beta hydrolase [Hyphomicrobiaceae bacterium]|nr:alpha/beta hydrolase [Hyphomicrobiaceae bacterium]
MPDIDHESEYNNRRRVPEHPAIMAHWAAASARVRSSVACELGQPYGPGPRHRYDLFGPANGAPDGPLVVYIHGGYWQRGDRADFSFTAEALVALGATVALPSYTLCPDASVAGITDEIRRFLTSLWERLRRRPVVVGHSAGGHLAAAMIATDWAQLGAPADLVRAGFAISGVFDLAPLIPTSLNEALRLTPEAAREASPLLWPPPSADRTFVAAVGDAESAEFLRQSREIVAAWSAAGLDAECMLVPGANHFTVVNELTRPDSPMIQRILHL